jgi:hypothetical protein
MNLLIMLKPNLIYKKKFYTGANHSKLYMYILVNVFEFNITHAINTNKEQIYENIRNTSRLL